MSLTTVGDFIKKNIYSTGCPTFLSFLRIYGKFEWRTTENIVVSLVGLEMITFGKRSGEPLTFFFNSFNLLFFTFQKYRRWQTDQKC